MKKTSTISNTNPQKNLISILKKHSGRDGTGTISVRHQGGRQKRFYREIDFRRDKKDVSATVLQIEYDPNRNAHIALIEYTDGVRQYILHPKDLVVGDHIIAKDEGDIKVGNAFPLKNIPIGTVVHSVELIPGQGAKIVRSAGVSALIVAREERYIHLKLPSGEVRRVLKDCMAVIGGVGNIEHKDEIIGSAGRKRLMGIRPTVRGTAQNPRTHPHGGGEGRSGEGMHPKTPWGKAARGKRTRMKRKWSNKLIVKRKK